jgi:hypothetical protein
MPVKPKEDQSIIQSHQWAFAKSFVLRRLQLSDDSSMISRQGIFLEYTSVAKQQGKVDGVSGVPILNVPEFTRLIRELFPTSQLINDAQNRQVFSGLKIQESVDKRADGNKTPVKVNGNARVNGLIKENGHSNGLNSNDEDSNHSQQSLDSVGHGGKTNGVKVTNIKSDLEKPDFETDIEPDTPLTNGNMKCEKKISCNGDSPTSETISEESNMQEASEGNHQKIHSNNGDLANTAENDSANLANGHSDKENDNCNSKVGPKAYATLVTNRKTQKFMVFRQF